MFPGDGTQLLEAIAYTAVQHCSIGCFDQLDQFHTCIYYSPLGAVEMGC